MKRATSNKGPSASTTPPAASSASVDPALTAANQAELERLLGLGLAELMEQHPALLETTRLRRTDPWSDWTGVFPELLEIHDLARAELLSQQAGTA